jgi:hypothetical protein
MDIDIDLAYTIGTACVMVLYFLGCVARRAFDPFAPVWLYFVGYVQVYVIQAISYREWALRIRGEELVTAANFRAFWALIAFLLIYHLTPARRLASWLPRPPRYWSSGAVASMSPFLVAWGLLCSGIMIRGGLQEQTATASPEQALFLAFPFVMIVAAVMLIVTGRDPQQPRPIYLGMGLLVAAAYGLIWMFNGKRSHSLMAVLCTVCAFYLPRQKRPPWSVLFATAFCGALVVAIAIGWRNNPNYERSFGGFAQYLGDFQVSKILECINVTDREDDIPEELKTYETEEYGGYLLIMDTVPEKTGYDYGAPYLRIVSTFIPRLIWPSKPLFGRQQWIDAWVAGSELEREDDFTGPAIGILAAMQLNGGAWGTLIALTGIATFLRTCYEYLLRYADVPWVCFWWSIFYFNAWFMVVNDDPMIWFYYNWGFTTMPFVVLLWWTNRLAASSAPGAVVLSRA